MDIQSFLFTNLINGVIGVMLLVIGYYIFNLMTPGVSFREIFNNEKITSGSVVISAFLLALALVIAKATM